MLRKTIPFILAAALLGALLAWNYRAHFSAERAAASARAARPTLSAEVRDLIEREGIYASLPADEALVTEGARTQLAGHQVEVDLEALRDCYALARWRDPRLGNGKVVVRFGVTSSPLSPRALRDFAIDEAASTLRDGALSQCIAMCAPGWKISAKFRAKARFSLAFRFASFSRGQGLPGGDEARAAQVTGVEPPPPAPAPPSPPPPPPALTEAEVAAVFQLHQGETDYCRASLAQLALALDDELALTFEIDAAGKVSAIERRAAPDRDASRLEQCVHERLAKWTFPAPRGGSSLRVEHWLRFGPVRTAHALPIGAPSEVVLAFERPPAPPWETGAVRALIQSHHGDLYECFAREFASLARLGMGPRRIDVRLHVKKTGRVSGTSIQSRGLAGGPEQTRCLSKALRRWTLPRPRNGDDAEVTHAFELRHFERPTEVSLRPGDADAPMVLRTFEIIDVPGETTVSSVGEPRAVERVVEGSLPRLRRCLGKGIHLTEQDGTLLLHFELSPDGRVRRESVTLGGFRLARAGAGEVPWQVSEVSRWGGRVPSGSWSAARESEGTRFLRCVGDIAGSWRLPGVTNGGRVSVLVPLQMKDPREVQRELGREMAKLRATPGFEMLGGQGRPSRDAPRKKVIEVVPRATPRP